jgi:hypothetical protein
MIEMKCPRCSAGGRIPRDKMNTRLVCKKCLAVFHLSPSGTPVLGEPPVAKGKSKEKVRAEPGGGGGIELGGQFDELAARFSKVKLPRVSGATAGITAAVILVLALGIWLFARQSLKTRAELVARSMMSADGVMKVMEVSIPETAMDVIQWHSKASMRYGELKMALGGIDANVNLNVLSDGSNGPAVVVAQFTTQGTRLGNAGVEALHPVPSLANTNSTLEEHLYFVKDSFGNWLLDGTRTLNDRP